MRFASYDRRPRPKILGAEIMAGLKKLDLSGVNLPAAKQMAQAALAAIQQGSEALTTR